MPDEFITPNWHVVVLHFPLGLLTVGVILEWLSLAWPRSSIRVGSRWMIVLGALLAIPALTLGIYAFRDVVVPAGTVTLHWSDVLAMSDWTRPQWELMIRHLWLESIGTGLAVVAVVIWLGAPDPLPGKVYWPGLLCVTLGLGLMVVGAWYSGEAVYRHGTAVVAVTPDGDPGQADIVRAHDPGSADIHAKPEPLDDVVATDEIEEFPQLATQVATQPAGEEDRGTGALAEHQAATAGDRDAHAHARGEPVHPPWILRYLPPLQMHLLAAGGVIALAMASIGLSIRRWTQEELPPPPAVRVVERVQQTPAGAERAGQTGQSGQTGQPGQPAAPTAPSAVASMMAPTGIWRPAFPARFWLTTFVLAALTAVGGVWMTGDWELDGLLRPIRAEFAGVETNRVFWHIVFGATIVLSTLLLAITARVMPRSRLINGILIVLVLIAVGLQIYAGVLMLYDSPQGSMWGFNPAAG